IKYIGHCKAPPGLQGVVTWVSASPTSSAEPGPQKQPLSARRRGDARCRRSRIPEQGCNGTDSEHVKRDSKRGQEAWYESVREEPHRHVRHLGADQFQGASEHGACRDVGERQQPEHVPAHASLNPSRPLVAIQAMIGADKPTNMSTLPPA